MRAAPTDPDFLNRLTASVARLAFTVINGEVILHLALRAVGFSIPVDACAFTLDARLKHFADGRMKPNHFVLTEAICMPEGMNPGKVQRFVSINVAHSGDALLVEQQRFDALMAS